MSEQDGERPAADQPAAKQDAAEQEATEQEAAGPEAAEPRKEQRSKHEPLVSGGAESTREMREMSRRRREAEEKLQHHLLEAKEKSAED